MKPSFLDKKKPLITAMVLERTPEAAIEKIRLSIEGGAEAIGFQLERMESRIFISIIIQIVTLFSLMVSLMTISLRLLHRIITNPVRQRKRHWQ